MELTAGQEPFAIILGCSDSRVPAEIIFDQGPGELFVIRVAGNTVFPSQVGSIEFAVEQFGSPLVVVLGHSGCGAVTAALERIRDPDGRDSPNLAAIIDSIRPALEQLPGAQAGIAGEVLGEAVRANVMASVGRLLGSSEIIQGLVSSGKLTIVGAEYSLETGRVEFFEGEAPPVQTGEARDLSMPGMEDAEQTHPGYQRWKHVIPLPNERMMLHVGAETLENFYVVADAWAQVLSRYIEPDSLVMDVGCGCGRTARLLAGNPNVARYTGFDVVRPYIEWCRRFFDEQWPGRFEFHHLDIRSERYNPGGAIPGSEARFPAVNGSVDFIYAASLFTHLYPADLQHYAGEMCRVLRPGGRALISIHDQPAEGEDFSGSEHRADYDAGHFLALMLEAGFELAEDIGELCGQRTFLLKRA